jgi:hypothetical protein
LAAAGATITYLPAAETLWWIAGLPNFAGRWVEATVARGTPAGYFLNNNLPWVRRRGGAPRRNWDQEVR